VTTNNYDLQELARTDEADKLITNHRESFPVPGATGYNSISVLEFLRGQPWDNLVLNYLSALRPSCARVIKHNGWETADSVNWRVTIYLREDNRTVQRIEQEVEVGLRGARHGHGLQLALNEKRNGGSKK